MQFFLLLSLQAPEPPKPALWEVCQTAQACIDQRIVKLVWGDFTVTLLASLSPAGSAVKGRSILCFVFILFESKSFKPSRNQTDFVLLRFLCRYYCIEGAVTSTPSDGISGGPCPEGHYCPEGSVEPLPCNPGTYVAVTHAIQCELCLPGWFCVSGSLYLCPEGLLFVLLFAYFS